MQPLVLERREQGPIDNTRTLLLLIRCHAHRLMLTDGMGALAPRNNTLLMLEHTTSPAGDLTAELGLQV